MQSRVAILDAGGQYVDLVRKAAIRQGFPADVLPLDTPRSDAPGVIVGWRNSDSDFFVLAILEHVEVMALPRCNTSPG